jgi:Raf kinase inhibitor-like YbhB/YbcL family protein
MKIKNRKKLIIFMLLGVFIVIIGLEVVNLTNEKGDPLDYSTFQNLTVTSNAFENGGIIPIQYTGRGQDISPDFQLSSISENGKSITIIMDDLDVPVIGTLNHWVIWNIPIQEYIPENIPHGANVEAMGNAVQGKGWGKHMYRGPKPPFGSHRCQFHVYVLDSKLDLSSDAGKKELLNAMDGHVIQYGCLTGNFK